MTIEIHKPELEAMIRQRIESGDFLSVEDLLLQALRAASSAVPPDAHKPNLADFLLNSPLAGSELIIERNQSAPRPIEL